LLAATYDVEGRLAPRFGERLTRLEREWQQFREHQVAANLHSVYFQARFGGDESVIRQQSEQFVDLFTGRGRVLDLGSGRGVFLPPNAASLSVTGHSFWLDPSHVRPIPPDLFRFYLEVEGFVGVGVRSFEPSAQRLHEEFTDTRARENARLLNQTLFGDRDYA